MVNDQQSDDHEDNEDNEDHDDNDDNEDNEYNDDNDDNEHDEDRPSEKYLRRELLPTVLSPIRISRNWRNR